MSAALWCWFLPYVNVISHRDTYVRSLMVLVSSIRQHDQPQGYICLLPYESATGIHMSTPLWISHRDTYVCPLTVLVSSIRQHDQPQGYICPLPYGVGFFHTSTWSATGIRMSTPLCCWFLPYVNMNQPQGSICLLPYESATGIHMSTPLWISHRDTYVRPLRVLVSSIRQHDQPQGYICPPPYGVGFFHVSTWSATGIHMSAALWCWFLPYVNMISHRDTYVRPLRASLPPPTPSLRPFRTSVLSLGSFVTYTVLVLEFPDISSDIFNLQTLNYTLCAVKFCEFWLMPNVTFTCCPDPGF